MASLVLKFLKRISILGFSLHGWKTFIVMNFVMVKRGQVVIVLVMVQLLQLVLLLQKMFRQMLLLVVCLLRLSKKMFHGIKFCVYER